MPDWDPTAWERVSEEEAELDTELAAIEAAELRKELLYEELDDVCE
jgi:hypothetical protein